jgi:V8-like Glu-specific endopeptidase
MPDPYKPAPYEPDRYDSDHPFLTEKGLRLQQMGRVGENYPIEMPSYPAIPDARGLDDVLPDGTVVDSIDPGLSPAKDVFDFSLTNTAPIHNVSPSRQFPDPSALAKMSLAPYFKSQLASSPGNDQLRAIGKLFIQLASDPSKPLATGSAWIMGPSTIATAAHNLYDTNTGRWSRALAFFPGFDYYKMGTKPVSCRITSAYVSREYMSNPATNLDLAICFTDIHIGDIVDAKIETQTIRSADFFDSNPVAIVGYPAGSGFDFGKQMWKSIGAYLFGQRSGPTGDAAPVMATDFGSGASGCPWIIRDGETGLYKAVGVTSGHAQLRYVRGEHNLASLVSPYFGENLFDKLADDAVFHEFSLD